MYKPYLFARQYREPNEDDRGDNWTPTDDATTVADRLGVDKTPDPEKVAADATAAALEAEIAAKKASALKTEATEGEGEGAGEGTDEEKAAAAAEAAKTKGKDSRIPAARHKEILDAERARRATVEAELAKYRQGEVIADVNAEITEAETKLVGLEAKYAKLITDGEHKEGAAVMAEIRKTERAINAKTSEMRETAATARAVELVRFDTTVERLEAQFPQLNVNHEDFDRVKTAEVLEMKEAWVAKGYTPSQALQKAVKYVMPPTTAAQEKALTTEARVDPKSVEAQRKADAAAKTAETVAKTPASGAKVGKDHDTNGGGAITAKDVIKMSYKDFSTLDEDALARARGDVL